MSLGYRADQKESFCNVPHENYDYILDIANFPYEIVQRGRNGGTSPTLPIFTINKTNDA
jgi:hypothetical protein